jgi:formylglycine-generating enzyme required for sulfatase activity
MAMKQLIFCTVASLLLAGVASVHAAENLRNHLGMEFVFIPPGEFQMGSAPDELDKVLFEMEEADLIQIKDEAPRHAVKISQGFWMGRTEVTQEQWLQVMKTRTDAAEYWGRPDWKNLPVVSTSWRMAQQFVAKLSQLDKRYNYRLPTEAEWEYAARAGSNDTRPMPIEQLQEHAWMLSNSGDVPHPVATRKPNAFGLYDTLGNAWEWVDDRYSEYTPARRIDPAGPKRGKLPIRRGGSYHCPLYQMRPAFRVPNPHLDIKYTVTGFRVVAVEK